MKRVKQIRLVVLGAMAVIVLGAVGYGAYWLGERTGSDAAESVNTNEVATTDEIRQSLPEVDAAAITSDDTMKQNLQYLIEEEKLAHDVYQTLYEQWGYRTFGNILQSELSHQENVLAVMETRNIADSRIDEVGKFTNTELQALYTKLVDQGSRSAEEALKVGVAIEELDISDLEDMIVEVPAADADVSTMMERLLTGSERHLDAFNRQLSRI